jgi:hypothetical protein
MDAEYSARIMGSVDPMQVKHVVDDDTAEERTHPSYFSLPEQWEGQVQAIQRLRVGEAFVRLPNDSVHKISTRTLPRADVTANQLQYVRRRYLERYFEPSARPPKHVPVLPAMPVSRRARRIR